MEFQSILDDIVATLRPQLGQGGKVADYIPALARVPAEQLGIALCTRNGRLASAGDCSTFFSIQSISKLFTLALAMQSLDEKTLWERIGREPSGNPFNSLVQLEREEGVPRNPFINAGAIAVADRLVTQGDAKTRILALMSSLCGEEVRFDEEVAASEAAHGHRNLSMAHFMRSFDKIDNEVAAVLDVYFHQCAIAMNCCQLARAASFLCRDGGHPAKGDAPVVTDRQARRLNALMLTCGTYDAAGEFAFRIGLPCKSGVGGGIVAVVPDTLSLCVWSPALDSTGSSLLGAQALEMFVSATGLSIF